MSIPSYCVCQLYPFFTLKSSRQLCLINKEFYAARLLKSNSAQHFMVVFSNSTSKMKLGRIKTPRNIKITQGAISDFETQWSSSFLFENVETLCFAPTLDFPSFKRLQKCFPNLTSLNIDFEETDSKEIFAHLPEFQKLKHLIVATSSICHFPVSDLLQWNAFHEDDNFFRTLISVSFEGCRVVFTNSDQFKQFIGTLKRFPLLQRFFWPDICQFHHEEMVLQLKFPKLECTDFLSSNTALECRDEKIESLECPYVTSVLQSGTQHPIGSFATFPNLTTLNCSVNEISSQLILSFPHLIHLKFPQCIRVFTLEECNAFQRLESLQVTLTTLSYSPFVESACLQKSLKRLQIDTGTLVNHYGFDLTCLHKLSNLQHISFSELEFGMDFRSLLLNPPPVLTSISIQHCYRIPWDNLFKSTYLHRFSYRHQFRTSYPDLFPLMDFLKEFYVNNVSFHTRCNLEAYHALSCPNLCLEFVKLDYFDNLL
jgi:hypothetical protein